MKRSIFTALFCTSALFAPASAWADRPPSLSIRAASTVTRAPAPSTATSRATTAARTAAQTRQFRPRMGLGLRLPRPPRIVRTAARIATSPAVRISRAVVRAAEERFWPSPPRYTERQLREYARENGRLPQSFTLVMRHDGEEREAIVHLPPGHDGTQAAPMVLNFHGYFNAAGMHAAYTGMSEVAPARGYITVHPQGTMGPTGIRSWNARRCCGAAAMRRVDDVGYVSNLLDRLGELANVDDRRVFATGFSNGGFLSYELARRMPDRIAAIAPVAGLDGSDAPRPERELAVMHHHGTADPLVGYFRVGITNLVGGWPRGAQTSVAQWARHNGATGLPEVHVHGSTIEQTWRSPSGTETTLRTQLAGSHSWAGDGVVPILGNGEDRKAASNAILDFFERSPMPESRPSRPSPSRRR